VPNNVVPGGAKGRKERRALVAYQKGRKGPFRKEKQKNENQTIVSKQEVPEKEAGQSEGN